RSYLKSVPERVRDRRRINNYPSLKPKLKKIIHSPTWRTYYFSVTYLSDIAVSKDCQHQGVGKKLIDLTQEYAPKATLILLSAPAAVDYYPKIGMRPPPLCCYIRDLETNNLRI
ncbi:MAG: ribosomal protein S18 acetylase RimI-like enzyme, partial [Saprospiraceae bacterium]